MAVLHRVPSRQRRSLPKWRHRHVSGLCFLLLVAATVWRAYPNVEQPRAHALSAMASGPTAAGQGTVRVVPVVVAGRRDVALFAGTLLAAGSGVQSANAEFIILESGLKYEVVKNGTGNPVVAGEQVQLYYELYLGGFPKPGTPRGFPDINRINDGKYPKLIRTSRTKVKKPSQYDEDPLEKPEVKQIPLQFEAGYDYQTTAVGGPIPAYTQGVLGMRVGEIRNYIVPPGMGYSNVSQFSYIPKDTELCIEMRLHGKGMPPAGPSELYYGAKPKYKREFKKYPSLFGGGGNGTATDNSSSAPQAAMAQNYES